MENQTILVVDFGGQYTELIARSIRRMQVYSVVESYNITKERLEEISPIGIIFTGGPHSVYAPDSLCCIPEIFSLGVPILGICYGMQYISHHFGGKVIGGSVREFGKTKVNIGSSPIFAGLSSEETMLMSHNDYVSVVPNGFSIIATTQNCACAAIANEQKQIYGVQFHPEVDSSLNGAKIIENFVLNICGAKQDYRLDDYINNQIDTIRKQVGDKKVLLALSGGVDSSVVAALISKAVPNQLLCVYVDTGLMRKGETEYIKDTFSSLPLKLEIVDANDRFLSKLKGVTDPEQKRKLIGEEYVNIFAEIAAKNDSYSFLAQGTIYPDVIESGSRNSAVIKSHHNVGGLPKNMPFEGLIEPLRWLFKDEVRQIGRELGLPDSIVERRPFPGTGFAIRTMGEVTKEKLDILRSTDAIMHEEMCLANTTADQYFTVLTDTMSVGVIGDHRNYGYVLALRAVNTSDYMTAEFAHIPYEVLGKISSRIVNEVKGISRVCYDVTGKPPATIEWE